jgi:hypothetical protein
MFVLSLLLFSCTSNMFLARHFAPFLTRTSHIAVLPQFVLIDRSRTWYRFIGSCKVSRGFLAGRDILSARIFEDCLCKARPFAIVTVNGQ